MFKFTTIMPHHSEHLFIRLLPPNGTYPSGTTVGPWMTARIGNAVWLMIIQPSTRHLEASKIL